MQNKGIWITVGVVVAVLIAGFAFLNMGGNKSPKINQPSQVSSPTPSSQESPRAGEAAELLLEAKEYSFEPSNLSVKKGQTVKLILVNKGNISHDFAIEGTDIKTQMVGPGDNVTIEFTIDEAGTYTFYCSLSNHRALGMEGELIVE